MNSKLKGFLFFTPLLLFLIVFFYWPVSDIFYIALTADQTSWQYVFQNPLFLRFFIFTLTESLFSVIGSLLLGIPTGYMLSRKRIIQPKLMKSAITVPFLLPPLVILVGFVVLFEPAGLLAQFITSWHYSPFSYWGIVLAHILYNTSLVARITEGAFSSEPEHYHHLADSLGASSFLKFRTITLPHIRPALESAILLVFLYSFNSFAVVLILGEVKLQTIEVMIYSQSRLRFNIAAASILSLIQFLINGLVVLLYATRRTYTTEVSDVETIQPRDDGIAPSLFVIFVIILTWAPVLMVFRYTVLGILSSSQPILANLFSSTYDKYLGTSSSRVLLNTLIFGFSVSFIISILGLLTIFASYLTSNQIIEKFSIPLTLLPMGTSAITVSFALLQTQGGFPFFSKLVFIYIIAAQLIAALPFATRALFSSWQRVPKDLILVSITLGAGDVRTFKQVVFPFIRSGVFIAFLFSFAISIGEFGATYYLVRGDWTTLSLAIERLFTSRNTLLPNLYASILVIFSLVVFWIIEKLGSLELRL